MELTSQFVASTHHRSWVGRLDHVLQNSFTSSLRRAGPDENPEELEARTQEAARPHPCGVGQHLPLRHAKRGKEVGVAAPCVDHGVSVGRGMGQGYLIPQQRGADAELDE